jgi:hypothetical protein
MARSETVVTICAVVILSVVNQCFSWKIEASGPERQSMFDLAQDTKVPAARSATDAQLSAAESSEDRRRARAAFIRSGIKAAAEEVGHAVVVLPVHRRRDPVSLEAVVASAALVILGTPTGNVCLATDDDRMINLQYQVQVDAVLKGNQELEGTSVTVRMPGGRVEYGDGTSTTVETPGFRRPHVGEQLLWCLTPASSVAETEADGRLIEDYVLPEGPLSLFVLHGRNGLVHTSGGFESPFARRILSESWTASKFLAVVRTAAKKDRE